MLHQKVSSRSRFLFLLHLPPPVHGSSLVGKSIRDSSLINNFYDTRYINIGISDTINQVGKKNPYKILHFIRILYSLIRNLINFKPDFVYYGLTVDGIAFYRDCIYIAILRIFGVRIVYHLHNKGISRNKNRLNRLLYRYVFNHTIVLVLSERLQSDVESFVKKENIFICPNGIPDVAIGDQNTKSLQSVKLLFLSNLIEAKGVFILLAACERLKNKGLNFSCDFIGAPADINMRLLKKEIQLKALNENINFLGPKYGSEKQKILANTDIFILPTYYKYECFPLSILEAMQFAKPVVSTYEGAIPDIVEDGKTGFLVPQRDTQVLADKLEILINNPELRKQMGAQGRIKYENNYTLEHFEQRFLNILQSICKSTND